MSRITIKIATQVSEDMTKTLSSKISKIVKEHHTVLHSYVMGTVPKEVLELYKNYPTYVKSTHYVQLSGNGFDFERVALSTKPSIPTTSEHSAIQFLPTLKEASVLLSLSNKLIKAKQDLEEIKQGIVTSLLTLKTYKRVEVEFAEAYQHLPQPSMTQLSIPIDTLREKIKQATSDK